MTDRDEFERRLLALVRDYMDEADELYSDGYEIENFMVLYQLRIAPPAERPLQPWDGGSYAGWRFGTASSSSAYSWWLDEALLTEALSQVREERREEAYDDDADGEEAVDE